MTEPKSDYPEDHARIIDTIERGMSAKGWRPIRLASECDISRMTLSEILRRKQVPSIQVLMKISEALEIEIDEFFGESH